MKSKLIVWSGVWSVISALMGCPETAKCSDATSLSPFLALSGVNVPEIPAKAANLVHSAAVQDQKRVAQETLRAVGAIAKPGVLPYVVSSICRAAPETAAIAVATATELQPQDVLYFTRAALCAAPGQVEQVVFSACRSEPALFTGVAALAVSILPGEKDLIRSGVVSARPELELYLEEAELHAGTNSFDVVVTQAAKLLNEASKKHGK